MASETTTTATPNSSSSIGSSPTDSSVTRRQKQNIEDMSLLSITDGETARGIPIVKFIEDVDDFSNSFRPPASAELLIGAYSELHSKFKTFETSLNQRSEFLFSFGGVVGFFLVGMSF
jgi:hypothetical protein